MSAVSVKRRKNTVEGIRRSLISTNNIFAEHRGNILFNSFHVISVGVILPPTIVESGAGNLIVYAAGSPSTNASFRKSVAPPPVSIEREQKESTNKLDNRLIDQLGLAFEVQELLKDDCYILPQFNISMSEFAKSNKDFKVLST